MQGSIPSPDCLFCFCKNHIYGSVGKFVAGTFKNFCTRKKMFESHKYFTNSALYIDRYAGRRSREVFVTLADFNQNQNVSTKHSETLKCYNVSRGSFNEYSSSCVRTEGRIERPGLLSVIHFFEHV